jgi:hypothetical protein
MPTSHDLALDTPLSVSKAAVSTAIPGETVILDPTSGRYFGLDGVGARVWEMLQQPTNLAHMIAAITAEYAVDAETCERDLRGLLSELQARGLVIAGDAAH